METLTISTGGESRSIELDLEDVSIGRSEDNIIQIPEKRSSRAHCRIDRTADGYELVDLDTPNGTRINGVRVQGKAPIRSGDEIQIGDTTILVGQRRAAPVEDAPRPVVVPAATATPKSERAPKRTASSVTPRPLSEEQRETLWIKRHAPTLIVPLAAAIAIGFGVQFYLDSTATSALRASQAKVEHQLGMTATVRDMQASIDAIDAWKKQVVELGRENDFAAAIVKLSQAQTKLTKQVQSWTAADEEWNNLAKRRQLGTMDPREYLHRLNGLKTLFAATPTASVIDGALAEARSAIRDAMFKDFDKMKAEVTTLVKDQKYLASLERINAFEEQLQGDELAAEDFAKGFEYQLPAVRNIAIEAMQTDIEAVTAKVDELAQAKQLDRARAVLDGAVDRFAGTPYAYQLKRDLEALRMMERSPGKVTNLAEARKVAEEGAASAKKYEDAKELMRKGEYARALIALKGAAEGATEATAAEFAQYAADVERFLALRAKFIKAVNAGELADSTWQIGSLLFEIYKADDERIHMRGRGGAGETAATFRQMGYRKMYELFLKMRLVYEDWQTVGIFCFAHGMDPEGHVSLIQAIEVNKAGKADVFALFSRVTGIAQPAEGFVVYNQRIMTARQQDLAEKTKGVEELAAKVARGGAGSDGAAAELAGALGKLAETHGVEIADAVKKKLADKLLEQRAGLLSALVTGAGLGTVDQLDNLLEELEKRRAHALKLIEDEKEYPYDACHGCKAQPEVDKRVEAVKVIWNDPFSSGVIPGTVQGQVDRIKQIDDQLGKIGIDTPKIEGLDLDHARAIANKKLDIQTYGGKSGKGDVTHNEQQMKENKERESKATALEKKQVEITNNYRIMMGRRALRLDDQLTLAARGHSAYMESSGQWGHVIPGHPNGDTPAERAAKEGYTASTGENIFKGSGDPKSAFDAWYNSSGHHRNMVNENWKAMGAGHAGNHWTQLFGSK